MIHSTFGNLQFNTGWKTKIDVVLFEKVYHITVKAHAYNEADGITSAQESAISDYKSHMDEQNKEAEALLRSYSGEDCAERFKPQTLLFERDGGYALLCDDRDDPDDGIAVVLAPERKVLSQDEYL